MQHQWNTCAIPVRHECDTSDTTAKPVKNLILTTTRVGKYFLFISLKKYTIDENIMSYQQGICTLEYSVHLKNPTYLLKDPQKTNNWCSLTHFSPISHFYTHCKRQKTFCFLTFSGVYRNVTLK